MGLIREKNKTYGRKDENRPQPHHKLQPPTSEVTMSIFDTFLSETRILRFKDKLRDQYGVDCMEDISYLEIDELTAIGMTTSQAQNAKAAAATAENIKALLEKFGILEYHDQLCALGVRKNQDIALVDLEILMLMGIPKLKAKNLKRKSLTFDGGATENLNGNRS